MTSAHTGIASASTLLLIGALVLGGCVDDGSPADGITCAAYCAKSLDTCAGANEQYESEAACLGACSALPVGEATVHTGDSLSCRFYHLSEVPGPGTADATEHCSHTGPGGLYTCGSNCEGYCDLVGAYCTGPDQLYADRAACLAACAAVPDDLPYTTSVRSGPHVACLLYHAQRAAGGATEACRDDLAETATTCR